MAMMGLDLRWYHTLLVDQDFWGVCTRVRLANKHEYDHEQSLTHSIIKHHY